MSQPSVGIDCEKFKRKTNANLLVSPKSGKGVTPKSSKHASSARVIPLGSEITNKNNSFVFREDSNFRQFWTLIMVNLIR